MGIMLELCGHTGGKKKNKRTAKPTMEKSCKRDMTEVCLKEDNATNMAAWRIKIISYTGDPR